jgi:hypothetical protein
MGMPRPLIQNSNECAAAGSNARLSNAYTALVAVAATVVTVYLAPSAHARLF